jgi:hypothetical protein
MTYAKYRCSQKIGQFTVKQRVERVLVTACGCKILNRREKEEKKKETTHE